MAQETADRQQKIRTLAAEILRLSHDGLLINLRFLDTALARLTLECREHTGAHLFDGERLYYDPALLLRQYEAEPG